MKCKMICAFFFLGDTGCFDVIELLSGLCLFFFLSSSLVGLGDCVMLLFLGINCKGFREKISASQIGMRMLKTNLVSVLDLPLL